MSIAKPVYKNGDKIRVTHCGPISLLMFFFSKELEKVLYNRLSHHMHTNKILVPEKFHFRQGKSTDNAASKLTDSILKSIYQKMHIGGIFCDLINVFDFVNH
jgi:hypothetical protein